MKQLKASQDLLSRVSLSRSNHDQYLLPKEKASLPSPISNPISNPTQKTIKGQNKYTSSDTRFSEISELKSKNKNLSIRLQNLEQDLMQIDEFKIAMELEHTPNLFQKKNQSRSMIFRSMDLKRKSHPQTQKINSPKEQLNTLDEDSIIQTMHFDNQNYHQKRVDILKAQLLKQQRYIRRITTILQSTRQFYEDLRDYLKYFSQVLNQSSYANDLYNMPEDQIVFNQNAFQRDVTSTQKEDFQNTASQNQNRMKIEDSFVGNLKGNQRLQNEKELLEFVDKKQAYVSLKNLLQMFKGQEEKDNFVNTFNIAFHKLNESERKNVEFSMLFDYNKHRGLIYKHPIKLFLKQFGSYFPVRSIYNSFPMKEKEKLEHLLVALEGMSSQIGRNLRKVDSFWLFKSNPLFFKSEFEQRGEKKLLSMDLPIKVLEEKDFFERFLAEPEKYRTITLNQAVISQVEKDLVSLLDKILSLQKKYYNDSLQPSFLQDYQIQSLSDVILKSIQSLVCITTMVGNDQNKIQVVVDTQKQKQIKPGEEPKELCYIYQFDVFSQQSFNQKFGQLESLVDDFLANIPPKDDYQLLLVRKMQILLKQLKCSYDIEKMVNQVKDAEIEFNKSKIQMMSIDFEVFREFMQHASEQIKEFFNYIDTKLNLLQTSYNNVFEADKFDDLKTKKQFQLQFKRTLKEFGDWVKRYLELGFRDNVINIRQLYSEFEKKVQFCYIKCESLQRKIDAEEILKSGIK